MDTGLKAVLSSLLLISTALALSLTELWSYGTGRVVEGLAFSKNGILGAASWDACYYVFDSRGELLNKDCGAYVMEDASYCCNKFAFVNDDGYVYLAFENGVLWKVLHVGTYHAYAYGITLLPDGFIVCWDKCAYFDLDGNEKWEATVGLVDNGPAVYRGYVYVPDIDWKKLLILELSDGSEVREISYGEEARDAVVCGDRLAVVTKNHLYLYDLSDPAQPRELWSVGGLTDGWQAAFSPNCKYIAVADWDGKKLVIYGSKGNEVLDKCYANEVTAVAWWRNRLAIGVSGGLFGGGIIRVYEVRRLSSSLTCEKTVTVTTTLTFTETTTKPTVSTVLTVTKITTTMRPAVNITSTVTYSKIWSETAVEIPILPVLSKLVEVLEKPIKFYNELGKTSGPLVDEIKKVMQRNAWVIAQFSRVSDSVMEVNKYLVDFYKSEKRLKELLNQTATYDTIFEIFTLLQRMKVDLAMANKIVQEVAKQLSELESNKPSANYKAMEAKVGPIDQFLLRVTKPMKVKELIEVRAQIASLGGTESLVKAFIAKEIDGAYEAFKEFQTKWSQLYSRLENKLKEYEEIAKYLGTTG